MRRFENTARKESPPDEEEETAQPKLSDKKRPRILEHLVFLFLFLTCLLAPCVVMYRARANTDKLGGVEVATDFPAFSVESFLDGAFQEKFDRWFSTHLGLRGVMIRSDNQLNFSLFRFNRNKTILGKKNYLFENYYLEDYNRMHPFSDEKMATFARRLRRLRDALQLKGVKLLVMLTPSKVAMHPEYVPERFLFYREGPDTYSRFLRQLERHELPVLDTVAVLKDLKAKEPYPVFAPGGAHWTPYACCKSAEAFTSLIGSLLEKNVPQLRCDPYYIREKAEGSDTDLARLANIWSRSAFDLPLPYPRARVESTMDSYRPKILFVGDSFMWSFFHFLEKRPVYETRDFFYYYQSEQRFRARQRPTSRRLLDRSKIDWNYVFSRDLIVLELNEVRIRESGFGFIEDALQQLESNHP